MVRLVKGSRARGTMVFIHEVALTAGISLLSSPVRTPSSGHSSSFSKLWARAPATRRYAYGVALTCMMDRPATTNSMQKARVDDWRITTSIAY